MCDIFKVTSLTREMTQETQAEIKGFLDGLDEIYKVRWFPVASIGKAGVFANNDFIDIKMWVRTAEEARGNDLILGIILSGTHVGIALAEHKFRVGDIIVDVDENRYQISSTHKRTGSIYWILDLTETDKEDIGDL